MHDFIFELGVWILSLCFCVIPTQTLHLLFKHTDHPWSGAWFECFVCLFVHQLFIHHFYQLYRDLSQFVGVLFGIVLCLFFFPRFLLHIKGPIEPHYLLEENDHLCIIDREHRSNINIFLFWYLLINLDWYA